MALDMSQTATKLTYDDLLLFPDDGKRHELLDGEHFVSPSPSLRHQRIVGRMGVALYTFARDRGLGEVFFSPFDVVLTRHDVVEPDLLFVSASRSALLTEANVAGPPDLVIEVLSPWSRRRDEVLKRNRYEGTGVAEYWIVDPEAESVKVLRRPEPTSPFARPLLLSRQDGDALATPLLPGFGLPLAELFAG
jgi:Uma2 family endonuclease